MYGLWCGLYYYILGSCCETFSLCIKLTCCYPCIVSKTKSEFDGSNCFCNGLCFCCCCVPCGYRKSARDRYRIEGSYCDDCIYTCFCNICSAIQVEREFLLEKKYLTRKPKQQTMNDKTETRT